MHLMMWCLRIFELPTEIVYCFLFNCGKMHASMRGCLIVSWDCVLCNATLVEDSMMHVFQELT